METPKTPDQLKYALQKTQQEIESLNAYIEKRLDSDENLSPIFERINFLERKVEQLRRKIAQAKPTERKVLTDRQSVLANNVVRRKDKEALKVLQKQAQKNQPPSQEKKAPGRKTKATEKSAS